MAGNDMASPALNNSKLILKEQRKLLTRKKSMEFFSQHVLIITKGKAARRRKQKRDWCNISNMRRSVSSPDETPRRELKMRRVAEYFWRTSRCFIWWWNTVSNAWYYFSNKMILVGKIKDVKWTVFHLISKHVLHINFLCTFFMNY